MVVADTATVTANIKRPGIGGADAGAESRDGPSKKSRGDRSQNGS